MSRPWTVPLKRCTGWPIGRSDGGARFTLLSVPVGRRSYRHTLGINAEVQKNPIRKLESGFFKAVRTFDRFFRSSDKQALFQEHHAFGLLHAVYL